MSDLQLVFMGLKLLPLLVFAIGFGIQGKIAEKRDQEVMAVKERLQKESAKRNEEFLKRFSYLKQQN